MGSDQVRSFSARLRRAFWSAFAVVFATTTATAVPTPTAPPATASTSPQTSPATASSALGPRGVQAWPVEPRLVLAAHAKSVSDLAFMPDGKRFVSVGLDGVGRLWDAKTGRMVREFSAAPASVFRAAVSADGKRLALAGRDAAVRVWDVETGDVVALLEPQPTGPNDLQFCPDGTLVVGGSAGFVHWDVDNEKALYRSTVEADGNTYAFAASADGHTAAFLPQTPKGRVLRVYDFDARKPIRDIPYTGVSLVDCKVSLSPDGGKVFVWIQIRTAEPSVLPEELAVWDAKTGVRLSPGPEVTDARQVVVAADGRRALVNGIGDHAASGADVTLMDATAADGRWRPTMRFGAAASGVVHGRVMALSPDGKTVVVGTGYRYSVAGMTVPGEVQVYDVPAAPPGPASTAGPSVGSVSWDVVPLKVRRPDGRTVALGRTNFRGAGVGGRSREPEVRRLADGLDAVWWPASVCLMRTPGFLDEVLYHAEERFTDVAWDGKYVWVASARNGLAATRADGTVVARAGQADGLPAAEAELRIHPLGPGRVLAVGVGGKLRMVGRGVPTPDAGWMAAVELAGDVRATAPSAGPADAAPAKAAAPKLVPVTVKVLLREADLPAGWTRPKPDPVTPASAMHPLWITDVPPAGPDGRGAVWVGFRHLGGAQTPFYPPLLRVDPDRLTWSAHNLPADPVPGGRPAGGLTGPNGDEPPVFLGDQVLAASSWGDLRRFKIDADGPAPWAGGDRLTDARMSEAHLVRAGDAIYLCGRRWLRYDLPTGKVQDLGPGLQVDGVQVYFRVAYYRSGFGDTLSALSQQDGCLYRFSADPARPAAVRPTLLLPAGIANGDGGGSGMVVPHGKATFFVKGGGMLVFRDGVPAERPGDRVALRLRSLADAERRDELVRTLDDAIASLRGRKDLSADERAAVAAHRNFNAPPPVGDPRTDPAERAKRLREEGARRKRLADLFAAYAATGPLGGDPTGLAAAPLLAEAEQAGRDAEAARQAHVAAVRAALGEALWRRVLGDVPDRMAEMDAFFPRAR